MSRTLRPLAAVAIVGLIGAGCSNGSAENGNSGTASSSGTASNTGTASNKRATDQDKIASPSSAGSSPSTAGLPRLPGRTILPTTLNTDVFAPKGKVSANPRKDRHSFRSSAASTHRPGGTSSGSPKLERSSGPRKVVISAIPWPSSVSTEMLRGRKLCHSSSQR